VFAHYLLYAPDSVEVLKQEIQLAQSKGIDAFALNTNVWRRERADAIYQAAKEIGPDFKLFFSADIHKDSNGNLSPADILEMMTRYKSHPNQLRFSGKQFFTAWLGSDDSWWADYGYSSALKGWKDVFIKAGNRMNYFFVPFFPTDGSYYGVLGTIDKFNDTIDGLMAWDTSAWPYYDSTLQTPSVERDSNYLKACNDRGKVYMATPSPWFFKNIQDTCCSSDCQAKNVGCGCQVKGNYQGPGLWLSRWQQIISLRPPLVEIVTWNDWVESSYVAPPLSVAAKDVADFTHRAFLDLGEHYIRWYKTGNQPAVKEDSLYLFYYTHSKNTNAAADNCKVANSDTLSDKVYVTAVLTKPACVKLRSGGGSKTFSAPAGISTWSIDFSEGQQAASLKRGGGVVKSVAGNKPITNSNVSRYNFNVYSASSNARNSRLM
jgi:glucan endo-1,3-alpha-glucosidase